LWSSRCDKAKETFLQLGLDIEKELWAFHAAADFTKYKTKFRSLSQNLLDVKNDLYARIVSGEIKPERVPHMTADDMAPRDLAEMRQNIEKHVSHVYFSLWSSVSFIKTKYVHEQEAFK
jgi:hypothetical protein